MQLKGGGTFRNLREKLRALFPDDFPSHDKMMHKMVFSVVGKDKSLNDSGRTEMSAWGASSSGPLVIRAINANQASSSGASASSTPSKAAGPKPKAKSKDTNKKEKKEKK